ncbi:MAG TPA: hypothetical protein VK754_08635 [Propionibacteriaceae bacterium]|nr:hypothetical protein [Propionibacteriaceae bacterium]
MSSQEPPKVDRVTFAYIRGPQCRTVFAEGAFGGPSPSGGLLEANFYTVHRPLPDRVVHNVNPQDGVLGSEVKEERVIRSGFVREVEVTLLLTTASAKSLHKWLGERIVELESVKGKKEKG